MPNPVRVEFDLGALRFTGRYTAAFPGRMYRSGGDPGDPPEGPELDITGCYVTDARGRWEALPDAAVGAIADTWYGEILDACEAHLTRKIKEVEP